ncbi:MAG: hypothetical protein AAGH72_12260 [Verrucomicrobiota bacterium]
MKWRLKDWGWNVRIIFGCILLATLLRFLHGFWFNPMDHLFSDPARHWNNATHFFSPDLMGGADPILYQLYLFVIQQLTFSNKWIIGAVTGVLCAVMPWTYYRASRAFGLGKYDALIVWAVIAWIPSLWTIYGYFMMETLLLPLVGLALWMTGRSARKRDRKAFLWISFLWVLVVLTKPSVAPLAGIALFYAWFCSGKPIRTGLWAAGLALLLLLPNTVRTWQVLGFPAPLGMSWLTKIQHRSDAKHIEIFWNDGRWIFSSPSAYQQPLDPISLWAISRAYHDDKIVVHARSENGVRDWKETYESLPNDLSGFIRRYTENWALMLFAPSWPDAGHQDPIALLNHWHRWIWAPVILFCVIGDMVIIRKDWRQALHPVPLFTLSLLIFLWFQPYVTMEGRYRKPLEPLLIMNTVWLCGRFFQNKARSVQ